MVTQNTEEIFHFGDRLFAFIYIRKWRKFNGKHIVKKVS